MRASIHCATLVSQVTCVGVWVEESVATLDGLFTRTGVTFSACRHLWRPDCHAGKEHR